MSGNKKNAKNRAKAAEKRKNSEKDAKRQGLASLSSAKRSKGRT